MTGKMRNGESSDLANLAANRDILALKTPQCDPLLWALPATAIRMCRFGGRPVGPPATTTDFIDISVQ